MSAGGGPIAGIGNVPLWGLSPAIDFMQFNPERKCTTAEGKVIRFLLIGQSDARHVLETVTKNLSILETNNKCIEFYLADDFPELIARQMLLLLLAIQPMTEIGLQEKCLQCLELFGNTLLRPKTNKTFLELSDKLINLVTTPSEHGIFDLSDLKFRERDDLVEIFKHWKSQGQVFPVQENWKKRIEKHLGVRYDARQNVFDWDYHMRLAQNSPCVISAPEYKKWRNTGIAFADSDADYSQPNVSLATGITPGGGAFLAYRGDIVTGPFISFGIEADDTTLFETTNGSYKTTAYEVSLHNFQRFFERIAAAAKPLSNSIRVMFLSPSTFGRPQFFFKFRPAHFDAAFFSVSSAQSLIEPMTRLVKPGSFIVVEDMRFVLEARTQQRNRYRHKIFELASKSNLETVETTENKSSALLFFLTQPNLSSDVTAFVSDISTGSTAVANNGGISIETNSNPEENKKETSSDKVTNYN